VKKWKEKKGVWNGKGNEMERSEKWNGGNEMRKEKNEMKCTPATATAWRLEHLPHTSYFKTPTRDEAPTHDVTPSRWRCPRARPGDATGPDDVAVPDDVPAPDDDAAGGDVMGWRDNWSLSPFLQLQLGWMWKEVRKERKGGLKTNALIKPNQS
jgi:hypothetical protein